jgi:hypothetical protein
MRKPPVKIATPESSTEVTNEVKRLLRAAGITHQLPTPKEEILACQRLVETGELDLAEYERTLTQKTLHFFHLAVSKVLGILDRRSEIIYVAPSVHDSRKLFVTYHEVTHSILDWQRIIRTQEDELTLSRECKDIFEAEANYGAADIMFQCERFETEAKDYEVSVESSLYLSNRYDASFHATVRRFVERNHRPCLLMVLNPTQREYSDGRTSFYVVYSIPSVSFTREFGDPLDSTFINPQDELGAILNDGRIGEIALLDVKGFSRTCTVQSFCNGFNTFLLVHPKDTISFRKVVRFRN